ncbi:MAG: CBS domain-containing protein [Desulfurococcales archaeon]|nr:CBS domain-containing protein [Desulfurococcales archaeon]
MRLTGVQREVLEALLKLYEEKGRMVKSKEVATLLGKDEGTIRNVILSLKSLGLVTSKTGPTGGYAPTLKAYELAQRGTTLAISYGRVIIRDPESGGEIELIAVNVELIGLFSSGPVKAVITVAGPGKRVSERAPIRVESTPYPNIVLEGTVLKVNETPLPQILAEITRLSIIPNVPISKIMRRRLITIPSKASIKEAARILYTNGIRGAPITDDENNVIGFITTTDIAMLIAEGVSPSEPVEKFMRKNVFTINAEDTIMDAIRLMNSYNVGRLLVLGNKDKPVGIITRTDILRFIAGLR